MPEMHPEGFVFIGANGEDLLAKPEREMRDVRGRIEAALALVRKFLDWDRALRRLGARVTYVTDAINVPLVEAALKDAAQPILDEARALAPVGQESKGRVRLRRSTVRSARLPAAFDGFGILHLSDLHADMSREALASGAWATSSSLVMARDYRQARRALAAEPDILLLDEPMAGMSVQESAAVVELLKSLKRQYTILLVEHDMNAVFALADRISVLVYGRLMVTGTPEQIRGNEEVRAIYLGDEEIH